MLSPIGQRRVLVLLMVSAWINFVHRGNLSVSAPVLGPELGLSPSRLGFLLSSFFWTYAGFQVFAGWLVHRYDTNKIYGAAFLVWSSATLLTGFAGGFASLFLLQLLLGLGQSVFHPGYGLILTTHFPEHRRGFANALIDAGKKAGMSSATFLGGIITALLGWRALFVITGLVSLLWLIPWWNWAPRDEDKETGDDAHSPGIQQILNERSAWATFIGLVCFNYAFYFLMTWLPSYLVMERKFTVARMAVFGALPFLATSLASVCAGWASDRWIARGGTVNRVRKTISGTGLVAAMAILPWSAVAETKLAMALLILAFLAIGMFTSNAWAITQTLAGREAAGKWIGVQNSIGNLGGVAAPMVTGWIVATTGSFLPAFLAASGCLLIAAVMYLIVIGPIAPIKWAGIAVKIDPQSVHS